MSVIDAAPPGGPAFRTNPSAIARYFFHDCERFLRFQAAAPSTRAAEGLPTPDFEHSPLVKAILDSGYAWEQLVLDQHLAGKVRIAAGDGPPHTRRFDWPETLELLRTAAPGTHIYQPTLRLPRGFYEQYQLDPRRVVISDNHPDLLSIAGDGCGRRLIRVTDLKRGDSLQLTHRVQVLLYALELRSILWASAVPDLGVDMQCGAVWLGGHPAPTPFELAELLPHLEGFLRRDLLRILALAALAADWHVQPRCEWCEYFAHCRDQMQRDDDLSRIAELTARGKRHLREEAGVGTTAELARWLEREDADRVLGRCASLAGRRPRLAQQAAALQSGQLRTHGAASPSLSRGENVGVFLTLQQEPLSQAIYLAGVHLTVREELREAVFASKTASRFFSGSGTQPLVLVAAGIEDVPRIRREFVSTLYELVTQVDEYNRSLAWSEQLSLQAYVLSGQERSLLIQWLLESLQDGGNPELAERAATLLFHFQSPELMVADNHPDREVPFPVVVLDEALAHVLALPVDVRYTLPEALQALGSRFAYRRNDYYHFALGHGLRSEAIHAAWRRGRGELLAEIEKQAAAHLRALRELLQGIRQRAGEAIFAWPAKFSLPSRESYADPLLSRLAFFARYESLLSCLDLRRWRCEPHAVQLLLGRVMELQAAGDAEFEIVGGAPLPIAAGGFPEWLLVADGNEGRKAQLEYRDYACRARLWQGRPQPQLAVVGITAMQRDKSGEPCRLTVEYAKSFAEGKPRAGRRYLLYPRFTDFTTDRVVQFLRDYGNVMARLGEDELFLRLLRDPSAAAAARPLPAAVRKRATAAGERAGWTPSQAEAFHAICQRRAVPVWGPPGTGKTHFLASAMRSLADAHGGSKRPYRVLVTAFTHAAIENLLRKTANLPSIEAGKHPVTVAKVNGWRGEPPASSEAIEPAALPVWLAEHPVCIVGATVHSLLKCYGELPEFELVVIDEASQVRVPEAAVPISLTGRSGRLVLAGDHLQLPPIVQGVYPEPLSGQPVLHRSIFEVLASDREPAAGGSPLRNMQGIAASTTLASAGRGQGEGQEDRAVHPRTHCRETTASSSAPLGRSNAGGFCERPPRPACQLTETFRMNDVLTSFAAGLLYGMDYRPCDTAIAARRLDLIPQRCLDPFVEDCLDPRYPLVVVVLDGVWAARESPVEARLVAQLVSGLRGTLRDGSGVLFAEDARFFREGVFLVSPHRAQIRQIESELRRQRMWQAPPFVDTVDKMQGQEADAVIVSYGVSDPEFAAQEAEFIYGLNRLNVAVTRARAKCVVFLPRTLLEASPQVLDSPHAVRGLAHMRGLVAAVARGGEERTFALEDGARATVLRTSELYREESPPIAAGRTGQDALRELVDDRFVEQPVAQPSAEPAATVAGESRSASAAGGRRPRGRRAQTQEIAQQSAAIAAEAAVGYETRRDGEMKGSGKSAVGRRAELQPVVPPLLARLNGPQQEAAMHGEEPLLIIAGAGTGKTTTLVHRVAYLISQGAAPQRMLLLTFTRRAAFEMLDRVAGVLRQQDLRHNVWGGTFHGVAARLLRSFGPAIGVDARFTIHDRGDAETLMASVGRELELDKSDKKFPKKGTCMSIHSYLVNAGMSLGEALERQFSQWKGYVDPLQRLFAAYAERKAQVRVLDYDDLLVKWCELLEHDTAGPEVRERFDYTLVDEYQDTNRLQSRLLRGLCPDGRGLTVVGDDAQSIYAFRAATIRNILDFPQQYPGARTVTLEQNYRSTRPILDASNRVIADARERFTKDLWSERPAGAPPQLITCEDEHDQVAFVVNRILDHRRRGIGLPEQAVLFRSAHHSILLEAELARQGLAFVKYGGMKFVEAAHVKDLLAFLRLAENPRDRVSGHRVLTLLPGIGPKKADQLLATLDGSPDSFQAWRGARPPAAAAGDWPQLVSLLGHLVQEGSTRPAVQLRSALAYYQPILETRYDNASLRLKDLEELEQVARSYESRGDFLAELALDPPEDDAARAGGADPLVLSTIHSAKGLEWKVVYVLHASDGKIPHERSFLDRDQLEEERRLFYVALTRAADWLYICYPRKQSSGYGQGWLGDTWESTTLTRFITTEARRCLECQSARSFRPPEAADQPTAPLRRPTAQRPARKR